MELSWRIQAVGRGVREEVSRSVCEPKVTGERQTDRSTHMHSTEDIQAVVKIAQKVKTATSFLFLYDDTID
jgi:hypothetical protein